MKISLPTLWLLGFGIAHAGDPTRPPETYLPQSPAVTTENLSTSRLQFIKFNQPGKTKNKRGSAAMIDGALYQLGDMIGDAQLVRINTDSVILSSASGNETLFLNPEIDIQFRKPRGTRK